MEEIFKDIEGCEGYYQISTLGRTKSLKRLVPCRNGLRTAKENILTPFHNSDGYALVNLYIDAVRTPRTVHRLVAETFIPNPENKPCVNHLSGVKTDCRVQNLKWCYYSENMQHAYDTKLRHKPKGESNANHILSEEDVKFIRSLKQTWSASQADLAGLFGITKTTIWDIWNYKTWKHI